MLDFRVPSEKEVATTVRVSVRIPSGVTVSSVDPKPGWTVQQGAGKIVWTADGRDAIQPDQAVDFTVRVAALPNQPSIAFAARQIYSDGTTVDWNQPGASDHFPAPTLKLSGYTTPAPPKPSGQLQPRSDWRVPLLFSVSGLICVAALVLLVLQRRRRRQCAGRSS